MLDPKALLDWTGGPAFAWVVGAAMLYWLGGRRTAHSHGAGGEALADGVRFVAGLATIVARARFPDRRARRKAPLGPHGPAHPAARGGAAAARAGAAMEPDVARPAARLSAPDRAARSHGARDSRPLRRAARRARRTPCSSWLAFNVTLRRLAHARPPTTPRSRSPLVHALEHAMFFGTALLFWTRVIDSPPWRSPLSRRAARRLSRPRDGGQLGARDRVRGVDVAAVRPVRGGGQPSGRAHRAGRSAARRRGDVGARVDPAGDRAFSSSSTDGFSRVAPAPRAGTHSPETHD